GFESGRGPGGEDRQAAEDRHQEERGQTDPGESPSREERAAAHEPPTQDERTGPQTEDVDGERDAERVARRAERQRRDPRPAYLKDGADRSRQEGGDQEDGLTAERNRPQ